MVGKTLWNAYNKPPHVHFNSLREVIAHPAADLSQLNFNRTFFVRDVVNDPFAVVRFSGDGAKVLIGTVQNSDLYEGKPGVIETHISRSQLFSLIGFEGLENSIYGKYRTPDITRPAMVTIKFWPGKETAVGFLGVNFNNPYIIIINLENLSENNEFQGTPFRASLQKLQDSNVNELVLVCPQ